MCGRAVIKNLLCGISVKKVFLCGRVVNCRLNISISQAVLRMPPTAPVSDLSCIKRYF